MTQRILLKILGIFKKNLKENRKLICLKMTTTTENKYYLQDFKLQYSGWPARLSNKLTFNYEYLYMFAVNRKCPLPHPLPRP